MLYGGSEIRTGMDTKSRFIRVGGSATIEEKKSRFIADVFYIKDEKEAEEKISGVNRKYYDAKHHCYAYIAGKDGASKRCSDNGEPSGTAGRPILAVIEGAGLTNALVVVTRYFGGVLLGTGGLIRAYTKAAQAGLSASEIASQCPGLIITLKMDYTYLNTVRYCLKENGVAEIAVRYGADTEMDISMQKSAAPAIKDRLMQLTEGHIRFINEYEKMIEIS